MIQRIYIKDFAIIRETEVSLKNGLTVITGETGAGKSILLKSLGIALGGKSDKTDVRSGQSQSVLEAELSDQQIYRRLISKGGRTRSFINDEPMTESDYRDAVQSLADFHGQHEQQYIMNAHTHIDFLDRFCKAEKMVEKIDTIYSQLVVNIDALEEAKAKLENASNEKELLQFQVQEIEAISPEIDEDMALGKEFKRLNNMDELVSTVQRLNQSLTEHDHSIYRQLSSALNELESLSKYDESILSFIESIKQASVSIQDASADLTQYADSIENDPNRLQEVEERLHAIESLKRKYGGSLEAVQDFINSAGEKLKELSGLNAKINELESEQKLLIHQYQKSADSLHNQRSKMANTISKQIENEMAKLNMPGATFEVVINAKSETDSPIKKESVFVKFGPKGYDQVEFFLSANPGEISKPLTKVASGGEVSRIMLAIKSVLKKSDPVETLIFDEIDSGISGQAAEKVAEALADLSTEKQVICITHLPQIASKADHHIYVHKSIKNEQTDVMVRYLTESEKIEAIAELFSGESISVEGISSAKRFRSQARG
ncbi:MAG: DNA repair protein RecN [Candidatus Marinimicrobia bacterium]|jgi:DNA repair protein RecN (Recombination protein N)|nr:DNA repair protein RecN [Candidatus Neomarinimicrobiota bacterium]